MDKKELQLHRTHSDDPAFRSLVAQLDRELAERDGDDHGFYAQFNTLDAIRQAALLLRDGAPVGCGAFKAHGKDVVEIKRMFVLPEFRNKGYARRVLKELEQWAGEMGYSKCILETGLRQPEAIKLYKSCGYAVTENFGPYKGVPNSVCFEKALDPKGF